MQSTKFRFSDVEWIYHQSQEIGPHPKPPVKVGVKAVTAVCKGCGHSWHARQYGNGQLHGVLGGVIVTCPSCAAEERVQGAVFDQSHEAA